MVDTGPFVATERAGFTPKETLHWIRTFAATEEISVSAIAYTELIHGIYRADSRSRSQARFFRLEELFSRIPVAEYTRAMGEVAGRLRAQQANAGNTLPFADSLIAAAAMSLQRPLLTQNLRDFERIPGLAIIPFRMP